MTINWPEILLGAFLSFFLTNFSSIRNALTLIRNDPYKMFYGDLYYYGFLLMGRTDSSEVVPGKLQIKKNYFGLPKVFSTAGIYKYKGVLNIKENIAYIHLKGKNHQENVMHIFNKPLSEIDFNKILSIKCAVTPEVAPASTINLLSQKELTDDEVRSILPRRRITIIERGSFDGEIAKLIMKDGSLANKSAFIEKTESIVVKKN